MIVPAAGLIISPASASGVEEYTGSFYHDDLQVHGDAWGNLSADNSSINGSLKLADRTFDVDLPKRKDVVVNNTTTYARYTGNLTSEGEKLQSVLMWSEESQLLEAFVQKNSTTYAGYLSPNSTLASDAEETVMEERQNFTLVSELPEPDPVFEDHNITLNESKFPVEGTIDTVGDIVLSTNDDELLSSESSSDSQVTGHFFGMPGQVHHNDAGHCYDDCGDARPQLHAAMDAWERDVRWESTFDELPEGTGTYYKDLTTIAWHPSLDDYGTEGATGRTEFKLQVTEGSPGPSTENPIRFFDKGYLEPDDGDSHSSWDVSVGIGYGPVGISMSPNNDDGSWDEADSGISDDNRKLSAGIEYIEGNIGDFGCCEEIPYKKDSAHGVKAGWGSLGGADNFYRQETTVYQRWTRDNCSWTDSGHYMGSCMSELHEVNLLPGGLSWGTEVADFPDSEPRTGDDHDFDYADRRVTDYVRSSDLAAASPQSWYCLDNYKGDYIYPWGVLQGPIDNGHTLEFWMMRYDGDSWDYRVHQSTSFDDPGLGQSYDDVRFTGALNIPSSPNPDSWLGHWKSILTIDGDYVDTLHWTIGDDSEVC